jgi:hypothetical protein
MAALRAEARGEASPSAGPELDHGDILMLQDNLQRLGYEVGALDGQMGPRTRRAIRSYLEDRDRLPLDDPAPEILRRLVQELQTEGSPRR